MSEHILIVEDEEDIARILEYNLMGEGFNTLVTSSGEKALGQVARDPLPDLIILDLMLPDVSGIEVCRKIRQQARTRNVPVIMLTAKGEEIDRVVGFEVGADDYVVKPFSVREFLLRVKAILKRTARKEVPDSPVIKIRELSIDATRRKVLIGDQEIVLTVTEFNLLHFLAAKPGWVFSRSQIIDAVKGEDYAVTERTVDVHMVGLRKKLGPFGKCINTVRGVGYRFAE